MTDKSGYSMLDLFRMEVESQATILNENLLALASNPVATKELEALVRATHAMKGAASIVELDIAIELTQKMKDCFLAAQNQQITLTPNHTELLRQGFDTLQNISQVEQGELETYLQENPAEIAAVIEQISGILTPEKARKSKPPVAAKTTKKVPPNSQPAAKTATTVIAPPPPPPPAAVVQELPKPAEESIAPPPPPPPPPSAAVMDNPNLPPLPEDPASLVNTSMLELFRLEADAQTKILNEGLLALESNPSSLKELEAMMRAAHSIKGAARIVGLDAAVRLAHVMEDSFVAAQKGTIKFKSDDVDILLQGVDLIQNISQLDGEGLNTWMRENRDTIQTTYQQIHAILNPGSAPTPPKKAAPPPSNPQPAAAEASPPPSPAEVSQVKEASPVPQLVKAAPSTPQTTQESKSTPVPTKDASKDRVVMVSADNLNRIMGLAGETLIEAGWLQPYADSLILLKKRQQELAKILENLQQAIANSKQTENAEIHLKEAREKERECREVLIERINTLELYAGRTANLSDRLYREVIASNMRPFADGVQSFPRMVRDIAKKLGKQVRFDISGKSTPVDRDILKKLEAPLTHILRNAVDHGIEMPEDRIAKGKSPEGSLRLEATHRSGMLAVTISDDGKGLNPDQLREKIIRKKLATPEIAAKLTENELIEFIFLPGFSTATQVTEISGRGVGLDIAKSMAHEVGGTVRASSVFGQGMSFHFQLPLTLSVIRTLLVEISGEPYAFPLARIEQLVMVEKEEISVSENRQYFTHNGENIGLIAAYQVLELRPSTFDSEALPVVVIGDQSNRFGVVVDKFLGERDLVVRPLDERLGKVQDIGAAALMGDGSPILIVDVLDLVRSIDNLLNSKQIQQINSEYTQVKQLRAKKRILVVDDSITVREMERKMLENKGYQVDVAVDGLDGWNAVRSNEYDLIVSDIDMPRMNGIEFVSQVKSHPKLNGIPVIIVSYRDKEEHRLQGLEAGANYYLTKSSFQDNTFMQAIVDLIGN